MNYIQIVKYNLYTALVLLAIMVGCIYILYSCNLLVLCEKRFYVFCTIVVAGLVLDIILCLVAIKYFSKENSKNHT